MQNETQASEPILFILSLGADPSQELQDLAKSTIGADKYHQVGGFHSCAVCIVWYVCVSVFYGAVFELFLLLVMSHT